MTATNHTEHYNLSQYTEGDHPTYTGDYNGDMSKIDAAIYAASQSGGGGMATVEHTADLTGDGTTDSPLGVADTIARTTDIPSLDNYATTESVTQAIAAAIADRLTAGDIKPGNGINIETSGNQVTISYVGGGAGGLTAVAHDDMLTGDGTGTSPLSIAHGNAFSKPIVTVDNLNDAGTPGLYDLTSSTSNGPENGTGNRGEVIVARNVGSGIMGQIAIQNYKHSGDTVPGLHYRSSQDSGNNWSDWDRLAFISEVNALTSRIATLESQVAALTAAATPAATGLTAEQLDSQYSDGYNIVRVGTPTPQIESEVNPQ